MECTWYNNYVPRPPAEHGTNSGYVTHVRDRTPICEPCRDAAKAYHREYYAKNPARYLYKTMQRYGLTLESYAALLASQDGKCAICGTSEPGGRGRWHIDHDHSCCPEGRGCVSCVRGLLCTNCNRGLGHFHDSPEKLRAALHYLERGN